MIFTMSNGAKHTYTPENVAKISKQSLRTVYRHIRGKKPKLLAQRFAGWRWMISEDELRKYLTWWPKGKPLPPPDES